MNDAAAEPKFRLGRFYRAMALYLGSSVTGVGMALPGALLPLLLTRWQLRDEQGGRLFLVVWVGASLGALLVAGSLRMALLLGSSAVAVASIVLSVCTSSFAIPVMLLYGLGLGVSMTSISLLRQHESLDSGKELVRINLFWAVGACIGPSLTIRSLIHDDPRPALFSLALAFGLLGVWCLIQPRLKGTSAKSRNGQLWSIFRAVPPGLIVLVMLTTGVEASAGGWLSMYAKRGGDSLSQVIAAPTCLWAGLLASRFFWSFLARASNGNRVVRGSLLLMAAASVLLLEYHHGWPFLLAATCLGFGIGPTYPLLLAWTLRVHPGGAVFFLAGIGSACLPWLTGLVSTQRGSLQAGFAVPASATLIMVLLSFALPLSALSRMIQFENPQ